MRSCHPLSAYNPYPPPFTSSSFRTVPPQSVGIPTPIRPDVPAHHVPIPVVAVAIRPGRHHRMRLAQRAVRAIAVLRAVSIAHPSLARQVAGRSIVIR
jgi:hypothetical protein